MDICSPAGMASPLQCMSTYRSVNILLVCDDIPHMFQLSPNLRTCTSKAMHTTMPPPPRVGLRLASTRVFHVGVYEPTHFGTKHRNAHGPCWNADGGRRQFNGVTVAGLSLWLPACSCRLYIEIAISAISDAWHPSCVLPLRCVVILLLCAWRSASWVLEQPQSSLLEHHDRFQWFLGFVAGLAWLPYARGPHHHGVCYTAYVSATYGRQNRCGSSTFRWAHSGPPR